MKKSKKWIGCLVVGALCTVSFYGCGNKADIEKTSVTEKESEKKLSDELQEEMEQLSQAVEGLFLDKEQTDLAEQITDEMLEEVEGRLKAIKEKATPEQNKILENMEQELLAAKKMYTVKEAYENLYSATNFMEHPEIARESLESGRSVLEELKTDYSTFYEKYEKLFAEEADQIVTVEKIREKILKLWDIETGKLKEKATKKNYEKVKKEVEKIENQDIREIFSEVLADIETALEKREEVSDQNEEKEKDTKKEEAQDSKTEEKKADTSTPVKYPESQSKPTKPAKPTAPQNTAEPSKPTETPKPTEIPKPTATPEPPSHEHTWEAQKEVQVVKEAWDEPIYEMRAICSCGADITNNIDMHYADGCGGSYSVEQVEVGSIHHDAVTQEVITGYVCSGCGARK